MLSWTLRPRIASLQATPMHALVPHWVCRPVAGYQQEMSYLSCWYSGKQQGHHDTWMTQLNCPNMWLTFSGNQIMTVFDFVTKSGYTDTWFALSTLMRYVIQENRTSLYILILLCFESCIIIILPTRLSFCCIY